MPRRSNKIAPLRSAKDGAAASGGAQDEKLTTMTN
jgi:hypothetical protein